jgi:hypothetical protein
MHACIHTCMHTYMYKKIEKNWCGLKVDPSLVAPMDYVPYGIYFFLDICRLWYNINGNYFCQATSFSYVIRLPI